MMPRYINLSILFLYIMINHELCRCERKVYIEIKHTKIEDKIQSLDKLNKTTKGFDISDKKRN